MKKWSVQLVIVEKYVGELPAETAHASMFTPEFQRMETLLFSDNALELLYSLMGDDVDYRKKFIMNKIDFSTVRE